MKDENKLGQEPAFPCDVRTMSDSGMSKRFYAACAAMQGFLSNGLIMQDLARMQKDPDINKRNIVSMSYEYADELLKQENDSE